MGQLLSVLAVVVSCWAWVVGKWEGVRGWMKEKAMSVQVEGWKGEEGGEGGREGRREEAREQTYTYCIIISDSGTHPRAASLPPSPPRPRQGPPPPLAMGGRPDRQQHQHHP